MTEYIADNSSVKLPEYCRKFIKSVLRKNGQMEIRVLGSGKPQTGIFNDYDTIINTIDSVSSDCYFVLNRFDGKHVTNKLEYDKQGVKDKDVNRINFIPMDLDPVRETGQAATDEQISHACDKADKLMEFLDSRGWSRPMLAFSGNGYHLLYIVEMPNNDQVKQVMKDLYLGLSMRFSDEFVKFDTTVRNPSRIFRMYGTINHKANRLSHIYLNGQYGKTSNDIIKKTAAEVAPPIPPPPTAIEKKQFKEAGLKLHKWDIVKAMMNLGLYKRPLEGNSHAVQCIWSSEHSSKDELMGSDCVVWTENEKGYPNWHCSHDHCSGRNLIDVFKFCNGL